MATRKNGHDYEISDEFWTKIRPLLSLPNQKKLWRPRKNDKRILSGIFYLLRTGFQWKALPRFYGAPSTVHDRFQEWQRSGFFENMWIAGLLEYDNKNEFEWEWQAIDCAMTKAPLDGTGTGANPTDRGKKGTKRTLDAIIFERPSPDEGIQNMCMDKGYDFPDIRELVKEYGYAAHIK